jgi:hypothetical protein
MCFCVLSTLSSFCVLCTQCGQCVYITRQQSQYAFVAFKFNGGCMNTENLRWELLQSRMGNIDTLATLGTQNTERRQSSVGKREDLQIQKENTGKQNRMLNWVFWAGYGLETSVIVGMSSDQFYEWKPTLKWRKYFCEFWTAIYLAPTFWEPEQPLKNPFDWPQYFRLDLTVGIWQVLSPISK